MVEKRRAFLQQVLSVYDPQTGKCRQWFLQQDAVSEIAVLCWRSFGGWWRFVAISGRGSFGWGGGIEIQGWLAWSMCVTKNAARICF